MYQRNVTTDRPSAGLNAERIAGNSPQKPARPGKPSDAMAQKPRIQPSFGAWMSRPPSRLDLAGAEALTDRAGEEEQHAGDQTVGDHAEHGGVDAETR